MRHNIMWGRLILGLAGCSLILGCSGRIDLESEAGGAGNGGSGGNQALKDGQGGGGVGNNPPNQVPAACEFSLVSPAPEQSDTEACGCTRRPGEGNSFQCPR